MRLLSATGEKHIYDETSVTLTCEGFEFKAKGKTVVQDGWKAIERRFKETLKSKEKDEPERSLPSLNEKDILSSVDASVTEHYTSPPKSYTEDSLLSAMETAGNAEFDDDTEKKGLALPPPAPVSSKSWSKAASLSAKANLSCLQRTATTLYASCRSRSLLLP